MLLDFSLGNCKLGEEAYQVPDEFQSEFFLLLPLPLRCVGITSPFSSHHPHQSSSSPFSCSDSGPIFHCVSLIRNRATNRTRKCSTIANNSRLSLSHPSALESAEQGRELTLLSPRLTCTPSSFMPEHTSRRFGPAFSQPAWHGHTARAFQ